MKLLRKISALFRKEKLDADMAEEMRLHLERRTEEHVASGMSPEEARYAAQRMFGGVEQVKEIAREQRRGVWFEQTMQDVRYAVRALRRNPIFTVTAVLTLAFGIGVNAALFSFFNAIALRTLPSRAPSELIAIQGRNEQRLGGMNSRFSYPDYLDYRAETRAFTGLVAWLSTNAVWTDAAAGAFADDPAFDARQAGSVTVDIVSENYFPVLGSELLLGRAFLPDENLIPESHPVIVLSHLFWERWLGADPDVIGKTVALNRRVFTVIGVAAKGFVGTRPAPPMGWVPAMMAPTLIGPGWIENREGNRFDLLGRLKPAITSAQAKADLDVIAARLARQYPIEFRKNSVRLAQAMKMFPIYANTGVVLAAFLPVLLGFALVLVIACTNVANLILARGVTRQREIGTRLALGASRGRIIRQLLAENFLLATLGGVTGLALAFWSLQMLWPLVMSHLPDEWKSAQQQWRMLDLGLDARVVLVTAGLVLIAGLVAGLVPALRASRTDLISAINGQGSAFGRGLSQSRLRDGIVVVQVAVCLMLLSCAGLLIRNVIRAHDIDLGFDPRRVFFAEISASGQRPTPAEMDRTKLLLEGPMTATVTRSAPLLGWRTALTQISGAAAMRELPYFSVGVNFFATFGIPLRHGRAFTASESDNADPVVIVSESLARELWPDQDPVGRSIAVHESAFSPEPGKTKSRGFRACVVIGVAADVWKSVWDRDGSVVYLPLGNASGRFLVRPVQESEALRQLIMDRAATAGVTLKLTQRLSEKADAEKFPLLAAAILSGALGGLALLMAAVGLYGVISFMVGQRVREIGIRMALGATAQRVVGLFMRQCARLIARGLVLGVVGSLALAPLLRLVLVGLSGVFDLLAFSMAILVLAGVAGAACWLPARRAAKVDPMVALRAE